MHNPSTTLTRKGFRLPAGRMAGEARPVASPAPRPPVGRAVGAFVPRLTRKAFEKYGFSAATLLTDWTTIAGEALASYTMPERLKWPRNTAAGDTVIDERGRPGATLVLRVEGPRALEVSHRQHQILERINAFFGYAAVTDLKIIQAPIGPPSPRSTHCQSRPAQPTTAPVDLSRVTDERLRTALARLYDGVSRAPRR